MESSTCILFLFECNENALRYLHRERVGGLAVAESAKGGNFRPFLQSHRQEAVERKLVDAFGRRQCSFEGGSIRMHLQFAGENA